jgi:hypothetical protein
MLHRDIPLAAASPWRRGSGGEIGPAIGGDDVLIAEATGPSRGRGRVRHPYNWTGEQSGVTAQAVEGFIDITSIGSSARAQTTRPP